MVEWIVLGTATAAAAVSAVAALTDHWRSSKNGDTITITRGGKKIVIPDVDQAEVDRLLTKAGPRESNS